MDALYTNQNGYPARREKYQEFIDSDHWKRVMVEYPQQVRYHAANLAAHNWDVIDAGDRLLVTSPWSVGDWWYKDGSRVHLTDEEHDGFYPPFLKPDYRTASPEEMRRWGNATGTQTQRRDRKIVLT